MTVTNTIVEFVSQAAADDVPEEAIAKAKTTVRDFLGVAIYGIDQPPGTRITDYVAEAFGGGESTMINRTKVTPVGAALANGVCGHAFGYDDTFQSVRMHPTSPIFSAALAVGESTEATCRDVLTGYVIGTEVAFNVETGLSPSHYQNGWHSTGTTSSFGAVTAAGYVLDLDRSSLANALGIVAGCSSSLRKNFGTMTKPYHAGHAAQMGVQAALLAQAGWTADERIFEADLGYGTVMTKGDDYEPSNILEGFEDDSWAISDIGFKGYPSGHLTHAPMEALKTVIEREDLRPEDVRSIEVTFDESIENVLIHENPTDELQAKFSIEFCMAVLLCRRSASIYEFTREVVQASDIRETMKKVTRSYESDLFEGEYHRGAGRVTVELTDGTTYTEAERFTPGHPSNPYAEDRLREKFYECVEHRYDQDAAETLEDGIMALSENEPVSTFVESLPAGR